MTQESISRQSISPLRRRMIEDMTLRNLAPRTQDAYLRAVKRFAAFQSLSSAQPGKKIPLIVWTHNYPRFPR